MATHYETPPMRIGRTDWRCVVRDYDPAHFEPAATSGLTRIVYRPTRCTLASYGFRKAGEALWRDRKKGASLRRQ